uniref:Uncharacterized protein n=1 Tax=Sphaerodactylus townsendi TaxID=933632 RepID=A0ACB8EFS3_9SAUR
MKMETQGSADSESGKDAVKASCIIRSERLKESWEEVTPENIKQEPEAGLHEHWEAQQHKTVRSPQSRWGDALLPGLAPGGDSPGEGASNIRQLFPGEETELLSGISGDTRHPVNNLLVKYQVDCQKVKEETLAERDANWDLERQCFRQFCYQDVEGPREEEVADFPETGGAPSDSCESPLFQEIEEDGGATTMGDERAFWKESNQRENSTELGFQWMLPGQREHNFSHFSDLGEASENHQETLPDEGKVVYFQQSFEHLNEIPEIQQRILKAAHIDEMVGENQGFSVEKDKNDVSEGNVEDTDRSPRQEGSHADKTADKPVLSQGGCFCGSPVQEVRSTETGTNECLHANQRIFSRENKNENLAFENTFSKNITLISEAQIPLGEKLYDGLKCGKTFNEKPAISSHQTQSAGDEQWNESDETVLNKVKNEDLEGIVRNRDGPNKQKGSHMADNRDKPISYQELDFSELMQTAEEAWILLEA